MTEYRRAHVQNATWFFTVNLAERRGNRLLIERIDDLRAANGWPIGRIRRSAAMCGSASFRPAGRQAKRLKDNSENDGRMAVHCFPDYATLHPGHSLHPTGPAF